MFSAVTIGLIVALSVSVWVYNVMMKQTGNNTKSSATTGAIAGAIAFVVVLTLVWTIDKSLGK